MRAFARCCYVALMHSQNDPTHDPSHEGQRAQSTRRVSTSQVLAILGTIIIVLLLCFAPHSSERAAELPASWWIGTLPFAALLGAIAVFPLLPRLAHWWHSNLNRYLVTLCASSCALIYIGTTSGMSGVGAALHHAIPDEYVPFMSLLFALYVIAGGMRIETPFCGKPRENLSILALGALCASFVGTTGAAMILIRPLLDSIRQRKHRAHSIVFFIFIVCNCGGALLPIGDPPLFMGYLRGVPFLWTMSLWKEWLLVNGALLALYFAIDSWFMRREQTVAVTQSGSRQFRLEGAINLPLLALACAAVAMVVPGATVAGTTFVAPTFAREGILMALALASWLLTARAVRQANRFEFGAIIEVAAIFVGIFIAMQLPLQVLTAKGSSLGMESPNAFYWVTGMLSSFLDNAPTYVVFFEIARTLPHVVDEAYVTLTTGMIREDLLTAISLGAVFMGANTYIGNGPNFMVKAIAESDGVAMPSFFGYMAWSVGVLIPLLIVAEFFFP